jgi:hypothetical protein
MGYGVLTNATWIRRIVGRTSHSGVWIGAVDGARVVGQEAEFSLDKRLVKILLPVPSLCRPVPRVQLVHGARGQLQVVTVPGG